LRGSFSKSLQWIRTFLMKYGNETMKERHR
jgi:hypothetical protein